MNLLSLRYPSPEFLECRSVSISDFNFTTPVKSNFSPSWAIYTGHGCGSKNNLLRLKPFVSLVWFLLPHRFEIMENSKSSTEEALNGSASSRQRLHHQEGATRDTLTASGHRADYVRPSRFSSSIAHHQLPCYPRRWVDNDDLLAYIDRHG